MSIVFPSEDCMKRTFLALFVGVLAFLWSASSYAQGAGFASVTNLQSLAVSANTGEKPQSKVWTYDGRWWAALATSAGGTNVYRLDGTSWTNVLHLSDATDTHADVKVVGSVVHILLYRGMSSSLVSIEYVPGTHTYQLWSTRTSSVPLALDSGVETATIDVDGTGRMWIASDAVTDVNVRWSDSPYSTWSSPIAIASGISSDDISVVTALPALGKVGVLWSNQNTKRFGFRTHTDGMNPATWSGDEVPASQSALNIGAGMADDHLHVAVASNGTLYAAVKTSYDTPGYPRIALLIRRPGGTWDNLYEVDQTGTRGIVLLNEAKGKLTVCYTQSEGANDIVYKQTDLSSLSFGPRQTLITGGTFNEPSSMKQSYSNDVVILATNTSNNTVVGALTTSLSGDGSLVAYYQMDEGSGSSLWDSSGTGNHGTIIGSPGWVTGMRGLAQSFNGTSQYDTVAGASSLNITSAITLAAWFKCERTAAGTQRILAKGVMGSTDGYELSLASTGRVFARLNQKTSGDVYRVNSTTSYPINGTAWMHAAATYDGTTLSVYINGVQEGSVTGPIAILTNTNHLSVGRQSDNQYYFQGKMDEARIYNRALTLVEIQALASHFIIATAGTGGVISPTGTVSVVHNGSQSFTITADPGYAISNVAVDGISQGVITTYTFSSVTIDHTINATFMPNASHTITATAGTNGTIAPSGSVVVAEGASQSFAITPDAGYHVGNVLVDSGSVGAVITYTFNNVTTDHTISASFVINTYTLNVSVVGSGSVTKLPDQATYNQGSAVQLTATPNSGWAFFNWSGDTSGSTNPLVISMDGNKSLTATFGQNLVGHWAMDEASGAALVDSSAYLNNGTITGTVNRVPGVRGQALVFDGASTYATVPNTSSLDITNTITIATWVRPELYATQDLVKKATNGATNGYELSLAAATGNPPKRVFVRFNQVTSGDIVRLSARATSLYPIDGTWVHYAATYDGATIKLYINGLLDTSMTATMTIASNTLPLSIGAQSDGSRKFTGRMDDVHVYNRALSEVEIAALAAHTITALAGPNGMISPNGAVTVNHGGNQSFAITPNGGYQIDSVIINGTYRGTMSGYTFNNVMGDSTIRAVFKILPTTHTITATAGANGSISPSGAVSVADGGSQTFTITPSAHYHIDSVTVNGTYRGTMASYTFTNVRGDSAIRAAFAMNTYTLNITVVGNGSVLKVPDQPTYNHGTVVQLTAIPSAVWTFSNWSGDATGSTNPLSVTMDTNKGITATFTNTNTLVGYWAMNEGSGLTLVDSSTYGNSGTISGNPSWVTGVKGQALNFNGSSNYAAVQDTPSLRITGAITLAAWIAPTRVTTQRIIAKAVLGSSDGYELSLGSGGKVFFRLNEHTNSHRLDAVTSYPTTGTVWMHAAASYDGDSLRLYINGVREGVGKMGVPIGSNTDSLYIGRQKDPANPCWYWGKMDEVRTYNHALGQSEIQMLASHTITATAGAGGIINPAGEVHVLHYADQTFTITPDPGYSISVVAVDGVSQGAVASYTFSRDSTDHTINATFMPTVITHTITATAGANGSISPSGAVSVADGGSQAFLITPSIGYHIDSVLVDGGYIGAPGSYTFTNVTADHSIHVSFSSIVTPDLAGYWAMDETSGSVILDSSTYHNDGTLYGNPGRVVGVKGGALSFDGNTQYAIVPVSTSLDITNEITIAAWVSPEQYGTQDLVKKGINGSVNGYELTLAATSSSWPNRPFFRLNQVTSGDTYRLSARVSSTYPTDGTWVHYAATYDGSTMKLYINGVLDTSMAASVMIASNAQPLGIGAQSDAARKFKGRMDEIRVYRRALSAAEIQSIAAQGNHAPNLPLLMAPPDLSTGVSTSPLLNVTVSDPDDDVLNASFYGREATSGSDFALVVLPDAQNYTGEALGGHNYTFKAQTKWIADSSVTRNIRYVSQVGDISNDGDNNITEWYRIDTVMSQLESPGIPYGIAIGNHDQLGGTAYYNQFFGESRFNGRPYYGGHFGSTNNNNFQLFTAGGLNFITINLEYNRSASALHWADSLLKAYGGRRAIVVSHDIIGAGYPASFSVEGQVTYDSLKDNPNVFLMLCGHTGGEGRRDDTYSGNTVHTLLADYQSRSNGGDGWMRILQFSPANNVIHVKTYSPTLNQYENDGDSQFDLSYDMQGSSFQLIGTNTGVVSGSNASVTWPGLSPLTRHEWYVSVNDGISATTGPIWTFVTAPANHTIEASAGPNGSISPGGAVNVIHGASQMFGITPASGYHVDSLLVDGVKVDSTTSYTFVNVTADHTIRAVFHMNQYTITASAGLNGTISPNGVVNVNHGATQVFTIAPASGYHVDSLLVDGVKVDSTTSYAFVNVTADHTIRAVFHINQYTITSSAGLNGTISPDGVVNVNHGATQVFTIAPSGGYHVDSLLVDGVKVDSTTSYTFVNVTTDHTIRVSFAISQVTVAVGMNSGWNLISCPVTVANDSVQVLYPTAAFPYAFSFSGGYIQDYTMENGVGYWEKFPSAIAQSVTGLTRACDSIVVHAGWNMVGTISSAVDTSTIVSVPPGLRQSNWFGYRGGYASVAELSPGLAYWVKSNAAGKFFLAGTPLSFPAKVQLAGEGDVGEVLNMLSITDSRGGSQTLYFGTDEDNKIAVSFYGMPPPPPTGAFDARFATADGGTMVQLHPAKVSGAVEFPITIQSTAYPLTVAWEVGKGTGSYELTDNACGSVFHVRDMNRGGSIKINNSGVNRISVKIIGDGQLPREFALLQNFPNPFNPSTTIRYALPSQTHVMLKIYDILGQEVKTLINEVQEAGYRSAEWNSMDNSGLAVGSGTYFCRLTAGNFIETKKLLLVK